MERVFILDALADFEAKKGTKFRLAGWVDARRDHGKLIFIDLRDKTGILQMVFNPKNEEVLKLADTLRPADVIEVGGELKKRPANMVNPEMKTGRVEFEVEKLKILNKAETPPFDLAGDGYDIGEENRLKYRYLDLRRPRLQKNLKARQRITKYIRDYLTERGFVEVETPVLTKSTPEGARDYVVPSRLERGKFYALPQSPQQYKQLLMVAGLERYFQFPRCFRDEDTRGDRQPEFTQLDIEMSFVEQEDVLNLTEELFTSLVKTLYPEKKITKVPWPRLSHKEAMEKYGTDRPDLRDEPEGVALRRPYGAGKNNRGELSFVWIVDFPAFEWKETEKRWEAVHHPFTAPKVSDILEIKKDPGRVLAFQYDFVLNGYEVGGGSIRVHDPELLEGIFEFLGHSREEVWQKFGHLLKAFKYGVPPHGGIASGLDRVISILENEPNIREVIAFPKTGDGRDLMMNAPSEISKEQLDELGLKIEPDTNYQ